MIHYSSIRAMRAIFFEAHPDLIGRDILTRELAEKMLEAALVKDFDAVGVLDQLSAETRYVSFNVPAPPYRFGVSLGLGFRIRILQEVRAALVKARSKQLELEG